MRARDHAKSLPNFREMRSRDRISYEYDNRAAFQRGVMRPAGTRGEDEIVPKLAAKTAHTISILPTLNANMRHLGCDRGENLRARRAIRHNQGLAIDRCD